MALSEIKTHATPITPGSPVLPGTGIVVACEQAGYIRLVMARGGNLDIYATVGTAELSGYAVVDVNAAGTTAVARVTNIS